MPPISPQGSRTALISWSVTMTIFFLAAAVFAIYFYVAANKVELDLNDLKKRYAEVLPESAMGELSELRDQRSDPALNYPASISFFEMMKQQRNHLAKLVAGGTPTEASATITAKKALSDAAAQLKGSGISVPTSDNLALAVTTLASGLVATRGEVQNLNQQLTDAKKSLQDQIAQFDQARQEMEKAMAAVRAQSEQTSAELATYKSSKDQSVADIQAAIEQERKAAQEAQQKASVAIATRDQQIAKQTQEIQALQSKFASRRVDVKGPIVRQADGKIIRVPSKNVAYINLGQGDSLTAGLTFEVYDKIDGIPPSNDATADEQLPVGKASIEVTHVGAGASECRIIRTAPGQQITEGDLIMNLVYDPNTKYKFLVYGDFDLDQNGLTSPAETDVVKRLVTQWGGLLTDKVNIDTDFVVLGKEPVLPNFNKDEAIMPENQAKQAKAEQALQEYQDKVAAARDLHIPIMNQNRFLYFTGYFDQAKR